MKRWSTTPKFKQLLKRAKLPLVAVAILVFTPGLVFANTYQDDINELDREIERSESIIKDLQGRANTLENRIAILSAEKAEIQSRINQSEAERKKLVAEIKANEEKKERQQDILGKTFADLYVDASISPIEMIASSDNITEYLDQAEYQSSIRDSLQESIEQIKKIKAELSAQKDEVEAVIVREKAQRTQLATKEREQSNLLQQTRGEESRYKDLVSDLRDKRQEAQEQLEASLRSGSYRAVPGGPVSAGQVIGAVGNSGLSSAAHLHLEMRRGTQVLNPMNYIGGWQPPGIFTQGFGEAPHFYGPSGHPGLDYGADEGTPITAVASGTLRKGCLLGAGYGYVAIIDQDNGITTIYAHMTGGPAECSANIPAIF